MSTFCPSAEFKVGALLLGIVNESGRVTFIKSRMPIDSEFVKIASNGRSPTKRFRFGDTCVKSACKKWGGNKCTLIDNLMDILGNESKVSDTLPDCSIRSECRWYKQHGDKACSICDQVITDLSSD